jgi:diguanylate cyclase (GGDEF)-like protein/PAS domain S-box-containing protein
VTPLVARTDNAATLVPDLEALNDEIVRLNKMVKVLMDRAERSANAQGSDFSIFQTTVTLEELVRQRTAELDAALRRNEAMTRALADSESQFRSLVNQSLVGITIIENGVISYVNDAFCRILGYSSRELLGCDPLIFVCPEDRESMQESIRKRISGEIESERHTMRGRHKSGHEVDVEIHGNVMDLNGKRALISLFVDVTERMKVEREVRKLQEELLEQSRRDSLTGLHNRRYFEQSIAGLLAAPTGEVRPFALIIADVDHFKGVNDRHGHLAGDAVLEQFASVLKRALRPDDVICRFGGEEFVILLPGADRDVGICVAEGLRARLQATLIAVDGAQLTITASFGVCAFSMDGATRDDLLKRADAALYRAKAAGRNRVEGDA